MIKVSNYFAMNFKLNFKKNDLSSSWVKQYTGRDNSVKIIFDTKASCESMIVKVHHQTMLILQLIIRTSLERPSIFFLFEPLNKHWKHRKKETSSKVSMYYQITSIMFSVRFYKVKKKRNYLILIAS